MQNTIKRHNMKLRHLFINGKSFRQQNTRSTREEKIGVYGTVLSHLPFIF